ncbi:phosphoglycerate kinase [bacterium]|nr:phosphoglycerate kinase [bacterium]
MKLKTIRDFDFANTQVVMRVDFNVPIQNGIIVDDFRIRSAILSIEKIINDGGSVILLSHLGRPKGSLEPAFSLKPVAQKLADILGKRVIFEMDIMSDSALELTQNLPPQSIVLMENVRFYSGEQENDPDFARRLSQFGKIYVNDAFGTAHRAHASTEGIAEFFDRRLAGFLMEKEWQFLVGEVENARHPFVAVMGGAKISGKVDLIEKILPKVDKILLGGGMVFTFFAERGLEIGKSLIDNDSRATVRNLLSEEKIILPSDVCVAEFIDSKSGESVDISQIPANYAGFDIGAKTIRAYQNILNSAKTILWNGPMGVSENPAFATGTFEIAKTIIDSTKNGAVSIVGGGDSASALKKMGLDREVSHLSTGGGASLLLLSGKKMPALERLEKCTNGKDHNEA